MSKKDDKAYCLDMLLAANKVMRYIDGISQMDFYASDLHQSALMREIQVISEAAWRLSSAFKAQHPDIPWSAIAGMRHRLVHDYDLIDRQIVWRIASEQMALLKAQLNDILDDASSAEA